MRGWLTVLVSVALAGIVIALLLREFGSSGNQPAQSSALGTRRDILTSRPLLVEFSPTKEEPPPYRMWFINEGTWAWERMNLDGTRDWVVHRPDATVLLLSDGCRLPIDEASPPPVPGVTVFPDQPPAQVGADTFVYDLRMSGLTVRMTDRIVADDERFTASVTAPAAIPQLDGRFEYASLVQLPAEVAALANLDGGIPTVLTADYRLIRAGEHDPVWRVTLAVPEGCDEALIPTVTSQRGIRWPEAPSAGMLIRRTPSCAEVTGAYPIGDTNLRDVTYDQLDIKASPTDLPLKEGLTFVLGEVTAPNRLGFKILSCVGSGGMPCCG